MISSATRHWLTAIHIPNLKPTTFLHFWKTFSSDIHRLFSATEAEWIAAGLDAASYAKTKTGDPHAIEQSLRWAEQPDHHLINYEDPAYPPMLKEIPVPPLLLYVKGDPAILSSLQLAVVGSRSPTVHGSRNAEQFGSCLAKMGFTITSGLAVGIDGAAHRGALAANGRTIAICGTGLRQMYPSSHESLANEISTRGGAVVSEFPLDSPPNHYNFPRRNRIICGLSIGVLVVEAAMKSGSLITARHALEQGREVFAIPGNIHLPVAKGCNHLIRQGARLVESAQDILEELPQAQIRLAAQQRAHVSAGDPLASRISQPDKANSLAECPKPCQQLLEKIDYEITPLDMVVWRTGLTAAEVSSMLLVLELKGYVEAVPGGYIRVKVA